MTTPRTRVGIIGAGSWAVSAHIPALLSRPDVELVGVCRADLEGAVHLKERFGFAVATDRYTDLLTLDIDAFIVASPSAYHYEHTSAALRSGAAVLCEKPMTIDPAEAWELAAIADTQNQHLLISFGWNFAPLISAARELLTAHPLGTLEHVTVHMSSATRELLTNTGSYPDAAADVQPRTETWTDPTLSGGGYGQAQLSHALGLLFHLFPDRIRSVSARVASPADAPVEIFDAATLTFDSGAIGVLSGGSSHTGAWGNKHDLQIRAIGTEGQAIIDLLDDRVRIYRPDTGEHRVSAAAGTGAYDPAGPALALIDLVRGGDHNPASGGLGALTVETLDLLYRSARHNGNPETRS